MRALVTLASVWAGVSVCVSLALAAGMRTPKVPEPDIEIDLSDVRA